LKELAAKLGAAGPLSLEAWDGMAPRLPEP
jgi:hypothetical protein